MSMDANELARLREVAEAATPGPWTHNVHTGKGDWTCKGVRVIHQILPDNLALAGAETDGAFIAAFDPPTVLALLDELAEKNTEIERLDETVFRFGHAADKTKAELDAALAEIERLRSTAAKCTCNEGCGHGHCDGGCEVCNPFQRGENPLGETLRVQEIERQHDVAIAERYAARALVAAVEGARQPVIRYVRRLIDYGKGLPDEDLDELSLGQIAGRIITAALAEPTSSEVQSSPKLVDYFDDFRADLKGEE